MDSTNTAQYPGRLEKLFVGKDAISQAESLDRIGHISIKNPTACSFGIWEWGGAQIHATLITTATDGSYVMIERYKDNVQGGQSPATNK